MKIAPMVGLLIALTLSATAARAQDLVGVWQGRWANSSTGPRTVLKISKDASGNLSAEWFNLDLRISHPLYSIVQHGRNVQIDVVKTGGVRYEGVVSADDKYITQVDTERGPLPRILERATKDTEWSRDLSDRSPHKVHFVTVQPGVELEVLDWGGSGRPLVFLSGLGGTGHDFDTLAPEFIATHHVYAITRRGYGASSKPLPTPENYSADRLGDDVLAVMDTLKLDRPVLVGWSIAGEELSSVATRRPEKLAGLVYLDAGYSYAFYAPGNLLMPQTNVVIDANELKKSADELNQKIDNPQAALAILQDILKSQLPLLQDDLSALKNQKAAELKWPQAKEGKSPDIANAILNGAVRFPAPKVPILALFGVPTKIPGNAPASDPTLVAMERQSFRNQIDLFAAGNPAARVVRLPDATHSLWTTNEEDVLREMNAFLAKVN